jgi:DNA polymerase-3 subunit delta
MNCHVLAGPDSGGIKEHLAQFRADTIKRLGEQPEILQYFIGQDSVIEMLANLRNISLFSNYQFVMVHHCDLLSAADVKLLKEYWQHPNEQVTVVFIAEDTKVIPDKFAFAPKSATQAFYELDENGKKAEIRRYLAANRVQIDLEALELLAELVSGDRTDIRAQCDMVMSVHPDKGHIHLDEVEQYIFHSREESQYSLFEYVVAGNLAASLESLDTILVSQTLEPVGVVIGLQWQFRNLLSLLERYGTSPGWDEFKALRITMKRSQAVFGQALRAFKKDRIIDMIATLARYDFLVREARTGSHRLQLECLLYELIENRRIPGPGTEMLAVL